VSLLASNTWNGYAYSGGDPVNHGDPTGRYIEPKWLPPDYCDLFPNDPGCHDPCDPIMMGLAESPDCPIDPDPPPAPTRVVSSCNLRVATSGTPRSGQNAVGASTYSPNSNTLGPYGTNQGGPNGSGGWFFQVQVQVDTSGDTDPNHWTIGQQAAVSGWITLQGSTQQTPWNASDPDDNPAFPLTARGASNANGMGNYDWLDNPGVFFYLVPGRATVAADLTLTFTSSANHGLDAGCSRDWSLHFTLNQSGAWNMTFQYR
jgi:hypothetical protein